MVSQQLFIRHAVDESPAPPDAGKLAADNAHERDRLIGFKDEGHFYLVRHEKSNTLLKLLRSVSGLYGRYFGMFDSTGSARSVFKKKKRIHRESPYYWLIEAQDDPDDEEACVEEIQRVWTMGGTRAADNGTLAHLDCELHLNDAEPRAERAQPTTNRSRKIKLMSDAATRWIDEVAIEEYGWEPFRTEYSLFIDGKAVTDDHDCDGDLLERHQYLVAGQADALFHHPETGQFHLVDWKFCQSSKLDKDAGTFNGRLPMGTGPLADVPDNSYGHYLSQQSIYAFVLKKRYGIHVTSARLLHVPSDEPEPVAREIVLDLLPDETVRRMFSGIVDV